LQRQRGGLCSVKEIQRVWVQRFSNYRARSLAIPSRVAPRVPIEIREMIFQAVKAEIDEALTELAGGPDRDDGSDGA